jgi:hypothetical protein
MHHTIPIGTQIICSLKDPGEYKEDFLRELTHRESFMRSIAMQEKRLKKQ